MEQTENNQIQSENIKQFEICYHPTIKSFIYEGQNLKGYWIDTTQFSKLTSKNKSVIISGISANSFPPEIIYEKIKGITYFFIPVEEAPFSYLEAKMFRLEENVIPKMEKNVSSNIMTSLKNKPKKKDESDSLDDIDADIEDLVIDGKTILEFHGIKSKLKGYWIKPEAYARLTNKSKNLIILRIKDNALPYGTQVRLGKQPIPHKIFIPISKPAFTTADALLFYYKNKISAMESEMGVLDNLPAWKEISAISRVIAASPGLSAALISLSKLGADELEKMYEFNKKLQKVFPQS